MLVWTQIPKSFSNNNSLSDPKPFSNNSLSDPNPSLTTPCLTQILCLQQQEKERKKQTKWNREEVHEDHQVRQTHIFSLSNLSSIFLSLSPPLRSNLDPSACFIFLDIHCFVS